MVPATNFMEIAERTFVRRNVVSEPLPVAPRSSMPSRIDVLKRPTILIFEESREMQEHYKRFLSTEYNLLMVETARYGVQMLQSLPVDVILFNVEQDRETEAVGMLRVFRRIAAGAVIPVVALTGFCGVEERAMLSKAGFDAYLARPFTLRKLREVIAKCMAKRTVSILNRTDLSLFSITAGL